MLALALSAATAHATPAPDPAPPWGPAVTPVMAPRSAASSNPVTVAFLGGLWFYRNAISPVDGTRCGLYPTCSAYATQAIRKHGFLAGGFLAADRLLHESGVRPPEYEIVIKGGVRRFSDPVEKNDRMFRRRTAAPAATPLATFGMNAEVLAPPRTDVEASPAASLGRELSAADPFGAVTELRRAAFLESDRGRASDELREAAWIAARGAKAERDVMRAETAWGDADRLLDDAASAGAKIPEQAEAVSIDRALLSLARGFSRDSERRFQRARDDQHGREGAIRTSDLVLLSAWAGLEADLELDDSKEAAAGMARARAALAPLADSDGARSTLEYLKRGPPARRSANVALGLSLAVPGLGWVYAGKPLNGLGSFLLNGLFIGGIVAAVRDHNYPLAVAILSLESGWYVGGATGAAEEVDRRNEAARRRWVAEGRRRVFAGIGPAGAAAGILF